MFEQSLLLNHANKRSWNFVASLGVELFALSVVLLIPLLYSDHLPAFHWKDVMVGPPPAPPPPMVQPAHAGTSNMHAEAPRPVFVWNPRASLQPAHTGPVQFTEEAPPVVGVPGGTGGSTSMLGNFIPNVVAPPPPPPKPALETRKTGPLAVGGDVQMAKLIRRIIPEYPAIASAARISGVVRLIGIIGKDGTIQNLQLVSGHPILARAAMDAVRQWVYKPTLLNGIPVEVVAPIEVNFSLQQ